MALTSTVAPPSENGRQAGYRRNHEHHHHHYHHLLRAGRHLGAQGRQAAPRDRLRPYAYAPPPTATVPSLR